MSHRPTYQSPRTAQQSQSWAHLGSNQGRISPSRLGRRERPWLSGFWLFATTCALVAGAYALPHPANVLCVWALLALMACSYIATYLLTRRRRPEVDWSEWGAER